MLKFLYWFSLFSLALGQLGALTKSDGANIYLFDIAITFFSLIGASEYLVRKKLLLPKYLLLLIPFIMLGVASLIGYKHYLLTAQFITSIFYAFRLFVYALSGVVIYNMLKDKTLHISYIDNSIYAFMLLVGLGGLIQLVVLPDFRVLNTELG